MEALDKIDEMRDGLEILENSRLEIIELEHSDIIGAIEIKPHHREIDLNDLINYRVMRRKGIKDIYTNDSHFKRLEGIKTHFIDNKV
jgi:predicted nucleic acid-binding protein